MMTQDGWRGKGNRGGNTMQRNVTQKVLFLDEE